MSAYSSDPVIRRIASADLSLSHLYALRRLFEQAWSGSETFTENDWEHAMGGVHFLVQEEDEVIAHAAVVRRVLHVGEHVLSTGYVEAVATHPERQGRGTGSAIMRALGNHIDASFELGALDTGKPDFYARRGWRVWKGPTFVRTKHGCERTPEEDGQVMVRLTPLSPVIDTAAPISCEWRSGDAW